MSRSYRKNDIPEHIVEKRRCIINTLRAIRDDLCRVQYTPYTVKNGKEFHRDSVQRVKRIGRYLEFNSCLSDNFKSK